MNRKPLPSEIEEQKDVWITEHSIKLVEPEYPFPLNPYRKKIIYEEIPICDKCGKVNDRGLPFIKGWDCECK